MNGVYERPNNERQSAQFSTKRGTRRDGVSGEREFLVNINAPTNTRERNNNTNNDRLNKKLEVYHHRILLKTVIKKLCLTHPFLYIHRQGIQRSTKTISISFI